MAWRRFLILLALLAGSCGSGTGQTTLAFDENSGEDQTIEDNLEASGSDNATSSTAADTSTGSANSSSTTPSTISTTATTAPDTTALPSSTAESAEATETTEQVVEAKAPPPSDPAFCLEALSLLSDETDIDRLEQSAPGDIEESVAAYADLYRKFDQLLEDNPDWTYEQFVSQAEPDILKLAEDWQQYLDVDDAGDGPLGVIVRRYEQSCHKIVWDESFDAVILAAAPSEAPPDAWWPFDETVDKMVSDHGTICIDAERRQQSAEMFGDASSTVVNDGAGVWQLTIQPPKIGSFAPIGCSITIGE